MMQVFTPCQNIVVDGDEFTSGFLGLDWFPSGGASSQKANYENETIRLLTDLMKKFTGWAIINEIYYMKKKMTIRPFHPSKELGTFNAGAAPDDAKAATLKDTVVRDKNGNMPAPENRQTGTGEGSNTTIRFSASTWNPSSGAPAGPGASAIEILLHEMVHGLRQMAGRSVKESVIGNAGMDNYEEFVAIVVSNIFRSELGVVQLRQDHRGFSQLTGPTAASAGFKAAHSPYLSYLSMEQPRLCTNLRQVKVPFNPLL
jgi:hypothetical protein